MNGVLVATNGGRITIRKRTLWNAALGAMGLGILYLTFSSRGEMAAHYDHDFSLALALLVAAGSLVCEYFDSSLGMGYGTTLTPMLIILGFPAIEVVPCILISQMVAGLVGGAVHHSLGNVDFRRGSRAVHVMAVLAACAIVGTVAAAAIAVSLPKHILNLYIALLVLGVGIYLIVHHQRELAFSWRRIIGTGLVAAFNKGMSGGGYGPLVTGGQILAGVNEKAAVGITSLAEGLTCLVGLVVYLLAKGMPDWHLFVPLTAGALVSVPLAAFTVRIMPPRMLKGSIGWVTVFLGTMALVKILMGVGGGGGG